MRGWLLDFFWPQGNDHERGADEILVEPPKVPDPASFVVVAEQIELFADELARLIAPQFAPLLMQKVKEFEQQQALSGLEAVLRQNTPAGRTTE